jgi:hypothetical protein
MQNISRATVNDGMTCVVTALAANNHVRVAGQDIDDFAFSLVAPLRANQDCVCHLDEIRSKKIPDGIGKARSGLADERYEGRAIPQQVSL